MKKVQSTCNYCSLSCNLDFFVENGVIVNVLPTQDYPVNQGFSCIKGLNLDKQNQTHKPNPLPRLKKDDGSFEIVSWDTAFQKTAKKLLDIKEKHGSESIAAISTAQMPFEEMALLGHVVRNYLQANCDGNTRLCMATSVVAHKQSFGFDAPPYTLKDFELSDTIILIGANPVVAHPIIWKRIVQNGLENKKIIVIDPRKSETAQLADTHLAIKAKSDLKLFYILAHVLIKNNWIDQKYITDHTEEFDSFKAFLDDYTLEQAPQTGLTKEQIIDLATQIHNGKTVSFWWTMGINQGYEAVRTAQAIINLSLMTGNIGRPGTGANSLTGQSDAMGSRLFSNQAGLYGGGEYDNPTRRKAVAQATGIPETLLPQKPTLPYNAIIEKINTGEIKALWVVHTNPRHSWANNETFKSAMEKLELLIVSDIYNDTDTSASCHVFFPSVSSLKKEGTYINTERRLSAMRPVLEREQNELTDFEVFYKMGEALGMDSLLNNWKTPKDVFNLMKKCTKNMPCDITGITYDGLVNTKGIQWPYKEGEQALTEHERRLYQDGNYYTPSKKARFVFETPLKNPLPTTPQFPYILNTGRGTVGQWHTQTRTREIKEVTDATPKKAYIHIHNDLADELAITSGETIKITSINGTSSLFQAKLTNDISKNELYAPIHYIETNALTPSLYDS